MNKIKSALESSNKHIFLGVSFVFFSLITSVYWGLTYAAVTSLDTTLPPAGTTISNTSASVIPNAPTRLSASINTTSASNLISVSLSWTDNSNNEDQFNINRKISGTTTWGPLVLLTGVDIVSYTDSTVTAGTTYDYQVEACLSGTGCSTP